MMKKTILCFFAALAITACGNATVDTADNVVSETKTTKMAQKFDGAALDLSLIHI